MKIFVVFTSLVVTGACGSGSGNTPDANTGVVDAPMGAIDADTTIDADPNAPDAGTTADAAVPDAAAILDAAVPDANPPPDAAVPDAAAILDADPNAPDADLCSFQIGPGGETVANNAVQLLYTAVDTNGVPQNRLVIEQYYQLEFGIKQPHTKTLGAQERQYSICGECILIYEGCTGTTCQTTFLAQDGVLDITEVGDPLQDPNVRFTGTLSNMSFIEVTIDMNTLVSTPVVNGQTRCITSFAFDAQIGVLPPQ